MQYDEALDARGLSCPLPIIKTKKRIANLGPGQVLKVTASDPGSLNDMTSFCRATGHELMAAESSGEAFEFHIRKRSGDR